MDRFFIVRITANDLYDPLEAQVTAQSMHRAVNHIKHELEGNNCRFISIFTTDGSCHIILKEDIQSIVVTEQ